jgi:hypothetical protein
VYQARNLESKFCVSTAKQAAAYEGDSNLTKTSHPLGRKVSSNLFAREDVQMMMKWFVSSHQLWAWINAGALGLVLAL